MKHTRYLFAPLAAASANVSAQQQSLADTQASTAPEEETSTLLAMQGPDTAEVVPTVSEWVPDALAPYWDTFETGFPLLSALVIVIIGYVVARMVRGAASRIISLLTRRTKTDFDDQLAKLLRRPLFISVFFFAVAMAVKSLPLSAMLTSVLIAVLKTFVVLVWIGALFPAAGIVLDAMARNRQRFAFVQPRTIPLIDISTKVGLILIASYALLQVWGIDPTAWLASAGVLGIAIGFAARDTLANLFSGFFILADAPYKLGDYVVLDTGERGEVTQVGLRSTRILNRDDVEVTVPNATMGNAKIVNESGGPWEKYRIRVKIGVAYGSDLAKVFDALLDVANAHQAVCASPEARVRMREFGDSSLNMELLCWVDRPLQRGLVTHELLVAIYNRFNADAIEIPFPQTDLHIRSGLEHLQHQANAQDKP